MAPMPSGQEIFDLYVEPMDGEGELMPTLMYHGSGGDVFMVFADTPEPEEGGIQAMLDLVIRKARSDFGPAEWIWFGSEAWARTVPPTEIPLRPGQLEREHAEGSTEVREVIMIVGVSAEGMVSGRRAFRRTEGQVVWLEDLAVSDKDFDGGVVTRLKKGLV